MISQGRVRREASSRRRRRRCLAAATLAVAFLVACTDEAPTGGPSREGPSQEARPFAFAAIGDFGFRNENEDRVARAIRGWALEHDPDALVTAGDNIYPNGAPKYFDDAWYEPYGWVEEQDLRVVASLGNHDVLLDDGEAVMDLFNMPARWFKTNLGHADLFVLDSMNADDPEQKRWLENALRESRAAWQIVIFHHPAYSCSIHGSSPQVLENFVPPMESGGVDLVINGHDHNYQRFATVRGLTYVVSGGGGANLYDISSCETQPAPELEASNDKTHHFLAVRGDEDHLVVEALSDEGKTLDRFELSQ